MPEANNDSSSFIRTLIIEDNEDDALLLLQYLKKSGFNPEWQRVDNRPDLLTALQQDWDIVFSDYNMPQFNGVEALEILRQHDLDVPFIFLSATIGEEIAVEAMRNGAQDYVMKGSMKRLKPAVERELNDAQQRRKRRQAEQARARLVAILEATPDLVAILDTNGNVNYLNQAGRKLLGLSNIQKIEGSRLDDFLTPSMSKKLIEDVFPGVSQDGLWHGETLLINKENNKIPVALQMLAHYDTDGEIEYLSMMARDISERKRFESELQYRATHDGLTGLPNRFFLIERFRTALETAQRESHFVAVLFLDMDNFKRINDNLGHAAGDMLLKQVARRFRGCLRPNDMVARHGGDEFTILLENLERPENAISVLGKLRDEFDRPMLIGSHELYATFSTGIAVYPYDGDNVEDLLRHADIAMYKAKSSGTNQYSFYAPDMDASGHELLSIEADLRHALQNQAFELHYQPQINAVDGRMTGVEALIRWRHPERGLMSPDEFVPLLESSGLIVSVGEWVLDEACRMHQKLRETGYGHLHVSVNVSATQFNDEDLLNKIERIMQQNAMPPQALVLEITENVLMRNPDDAAVILQKLHDIGVRIAIDDFGTGYSSLAYLKHFPLNVLKIDRTFVNELNDQSGDAAIIEASISLAQKLGLEVVAEGVETSQQLLFLQNRECHLVQGFYMSHPLPEQELFDLLPKISHLPSA